MRKETILVDGKEELVHSHLLELRPSGLPADEYKLVNGKYKIAESEISLNIKEKIKEVEEQRDADLNNANNTVTKDGVIYQMDSDTRKYLLETITLYSVSGNTPEGFEWRDIDNNMHLASLDFLVGLASKQAEKEREIWGKSFKDKEALRATLS